MEGKSDTSKTELKTMRRSKIYYARMRATAIKQVEGIKFICEIYKKTVYTLLCREGSNKIEKSETESSVSMQGTQLYRQSFKERLQSDTELKRLPTNELKDLRS